MCGVAQHISQGRNTQVTRDFQFYFKIHHPHVFGCLRLEGAVVHDALVDRYAGRERDAFGHCDTLDLTSEDLRASLCSRG